MGWSKLATGILLVVLTVAAVAVSVLRIVAGGSTERLRGCVSLVAIGGMLAVVITVSIIFLQVGNTGGLFWPQGAPGSAQPTSNPINEPSFATPAGGSLP